MKKKQPKYPLALIKQLATHARQEGLSLEEVARDLQKGVANVILSAEMDEHLASEEQEGNHRNGYSSKTVHTDSSSIELAVPRDRQGNFEPKLVEKHCRRMPGFDRKVIALYARGMSTRDIQSHIEEIYGVEISPSLVSRVTEEVSADIAAWQNRPLDSSYPFVFFDGARVKTRYEGRVVNMVIYVALAFNNAGRKELLGLWLFPTESAKLWQQVFADLANRGVERIFYAIVDNLSGIRDAVEAVFPDTIVQTCIVHLLRNSLRFACYEKRKPLADALKAIYQAPSEKAAAIALQEFAEGPFGAAYPPIVKMWRKNWEYIIPFFSFSPEVRTLMYTTNAVESVNSVVRKAVRNRGHFPNETSAIKSVFMLLEPLMAKWTMPVRGWASAKIQLAIQFGDEFDIQD